METRTVIGDYWGLVVKYDNMVTEWLCGVLWRISTFLTSSVRGDVLLPGERPEWNQT